MLLRSIVAHSLGIYRAHQVQQETKEKSMPLGVMTGASVPKGSLRRRCLIRALEDCVSTARWCDAHPKSTNIACDVKLVPGYSFDALDRQLYGLFGDQEAAAGLEDEEQQQPHCNAWLCSTDSV